MDIEVLDSKEVWWETTTEYDLIVNDEAIKFRVAENPKGVELFVYVDDMWQEIDRENAVEAAIEDAYYEGEIE